MSNPMDGSPPASSVHGILQARILEWVACPTPGDLPNPGIEPASPALQADSLPPSHQGNPHMRVDGTPLQYPFTACWSSREFEFY